MAYWGHQSSPCSTSPQTLSSIHPQTISQSRAYATPCVALVLCCNEYEGSPLTLSPISLFLQGIKEVTLLGQNVNSYRDLSEIQHSIGIDEVSRLSEGFNTIYKSKKGGRRFSDLLENVSLIDPEMRIRFTSPHPKDFPDEVNNPFNPFRTGAVLQIFWIIECPM
jgi:hypothetical protein